MKNFKQMKRRDFVKLKSFFAETMETTFRQKKKPIFFLMKHDFYITISSAIAFNCSLARFASWS